MTAVILVPDWHTSAACAGRPGLMADETRVLQALDVCRTCPVAVTCRQWVMGLSDADDPGGVCGGMTEAGRKRQRWLASPARAARVAAGLARDAERKAQAEAQLRSYAMLRQSMPLPAAAAELGISATVAVQLEDRFAIGAGQVEVAS